MRTPRHASTTTSSNFPTSATTPSVRSRKSHAGRRKDTRLEARITDAQKALLQKAAELRGQTLTEFVVRAGEIAATRVLEHAGVWVLSAHDSRALVDALLNPPPPGARLRAAAARYAATDADPSPRKA
jgi:uncharacterized protein (DUF1778 family)